MIYIKCRYKYCKHNNEVKKEDAIKEGSAYYCKDCYKEKELKQEIEKYYLANYPPATIQILRKVVNQLLYINNYEADYIFYIVQKIHNNKLKINNPFGLVNYCNEGRNKEEWNKLRINNEFKAIKQEVRDIKNIDKVEFKYDPNIKKWTDVL